MLRLVIILLFVASAMLTPASSKKRSAINNESPILTTFKHFHFEEKSREQHTEITSPKVLEQEHHEWIAEKPIIRRQGQQNDHWDINANEASFIENFSTITLNGQVHATNEGQNISKLDTEKLIVDKTKNTYHTFGSTKVISDGQLLTSQELVFNGNSKNILLPKPGKLIYTHNHENVG